MGNRSRTASMSTFTNPVIRGFAHSGSCEHRGNHHDRCVGVHHGLKDGSVLLARSAAAILGARNVKIRAPAERGAALSSVRPPLCEQTARAIFDEGQGQLFRKGEVIVRVTTLFPPDASSHARLDGREHARNRSAAGREAAGRPTLPG